MPKPTKEQIEFAKAMWNLATGFGSDTATTSFSPPYSKDNPAQRGYALGYLQRVRCLKFLKTPEGQQLTGVDCKRATSSPDKERFVRKVLEEVFSHCVRLSKLNEYKHEDYKRVGQARGLPDGDYVLFTGFFNFIYSPSRPAWTLDWKQQQRALEPAPAPVPAPAPRRVSNVCEMDESDDEAPPAPAPAPAPVRSGGTPPPVMAPPNPQRYVPASGWMPARGFGQSAVETEGVKNMIAYAASDDCKVASGTSRSYISTARKDEANNWANANDKELNKRTGSKPLTAKTFYDKAQRWAREQREAIAKPIAETKSKTAPMPGPVVVQGADLSEWEARPAEQPVPAPKPVVQTTLDGAPLQDYVAPDHSAGEQWPGPQRPTQQQTLDAFVSAPRATNFAGESGLPPELADRPRVSLANLLGVTSAATPLRARELDERLPSEPDEEWELTRAAPGEVFDTDRPHSPPRPAPAPAAPAPAPAPARPRLPAGAIMLSSEIAREFFEEEEREERERAAKEREAAAKLAKKRKRDPDMDASAGVNADWRLDGMGRQVLRDFIMAKAAAASGLLEFNANSVAIFRARDAGFTTHVKQRTRGSSAGHTDGYVVLSNALKRSTGKGQLRSEAEITRFFNARPELRDADAEAIDSEVL